MNRFLASFLASGFLLTFDCPSLAHDRSKKTGVLMPGIKVLVYDYVQVPWPTLGRTEREVARIFHDAGIEVTWRSCNTGMTGIHQEADCTHEVRPADLLLRIVSEIATIPGFTPDTTMGFAIGNLASVSFSRVREEAVRFEVSPSEVLIPAIAHEIGHMLGQRGHSPTGIMRARWERRDYIALPRGVFKFTAEQAEQMRAEVSTRNRMQQADALPGTAARK